MPSKVRLELHGGTGCLVVDGVDLTSSVTDIELLWNDRTRSPELVVTLAIVELKSEIDDARLVMAPETEAAIRALGWSPPGSGDVPGG